MEVATATAGLAQSEILTPDEQTTSNLNDYETERGKPMPSTNHAAIQLNLGTELKNRYGKKFRILSEQTLELSDPPTVPDICLYPFFKLNLQNDIIRRTDPPTLTIEILSPSQMLRTLVEKSNEYLRLGVQSAWIVIPEMEAIAVYHEPGKFDFFKDNEVLKDSKLGIELPLEKVFE